jgi:hypothetical protein
MNKYNEDLLVLAGLFVTGSYFCASNQIPGTMQRYNVFLQIHKGLRVMLYDTSTALQQADLETAGADHPALKKLAATLDFFDGHAHHEDTHVFSMLQQFEPEFVTAMEAEHVADHALSNELRSLILDLRQATSPEEKYAIGNRLCHTFNAFTVFNLTHLHKEETEVNELLWKHYTDMDIIVANRQLVATLTPDEAQQSAYWMLRSGSDNELAKLFAGMKAGAPAEAFAGLMAMAQEVLPADRFEKLESRISVAV